MTTWAVLDAAIADVETVASKYERARRGLSEQFLAAYEVTLASLRTSPRMGTPLPLGRFVVRRVMLTGFPYAVVVAEVAAETFLVVAVTHARRHPKHWRARVRGARPR